MNVTQTGLDSSSADDDAFHKDWIRLGWEGCRLQFPCICRQWAATHGVSTTAQLWWLWGWWKKRRGTGRGMWGKNNAELYWSCATHRTVKNYSFTHYTGKYDKQNIFNIWFQLNACHLQISLEKIDLHTGTKVPFYLFIISVGVKCKMSISCFLMFLTDLLLSCSRCISPIINFFCSPFRNKGQQFPSTQMK